VKPATHDSWMGKEVSQGGMEDKLMSRISAAWFCGYAFAFGISMIFPQLVRKYYDESKQLKRHIEHDAK